MASKIKVDQLETADGSGTIALQNQLSGMTSASMPTGSVLQVVNATTTSETTTTSTSFVTTTLTGSITPSSTSNKILVAFSSCVRKNTSNPSLILTLFRGTVGGTNLAGDWGFGIVSGNTGEVDVAGVSATYLDSPSTTSSQTYTVGFRCSTADSVMVQVNGSKSTMTLMEIAG